MFLRPLIIVSVGIVLTPHIYGQTVIPSEDTEAIRTTNFKHFDEYWMPNKLTDLITKAKEANRNEVVIGKDPRYFHEHISKGPLPAADLLSLGGNASITLEGIPESRISGPCASNTFVCSDYKVFVSRIWNNYGVAVLAGQTIIVARGGGEFKVDGVSVRGTDANFHLFKLGEKYIFFLTLLADSGAFAVKPGRAFLEEGNKILDGRSSRGIPPTDREIFINELEKELPHMQRQAR